MIRPGDIGLGAKRKGFYPSAVRWFTKSKYSHVFLICHEYYEQLQVFEVDLKVQTVPFNKEYVEKNDDSYVIYRPIRATESEIYNAAKLVHNTRAGGLYGFLQIPWFAVRSILQKVGIHLKRNWFPSNDICSEMPLIYLKALNKEYAGAFFLLTENETSPQDIAKIVESRPDLFEFVTERV